MKSKQLKKDKIKKELYSRAEALVSRDILEEISSIQNNLIDNNDFLSPNAEERRRILQLLEKLSKYDSNNPYMEKIKETYKISKWYKKLIAENFKLFGFGIHRDFLYLQNKEIELSQEVVLSSLVLPSHNLEYLASTAKALKLRNPILKYIVVTKNFSSFNIEFDNESVVLFIQRDKRA